MKTKIEILIVLSCLLVSQPGFSGTRFDVLMTRFDKADSPVTPQDLEGAFLGRCYQSDSDAPRGMVLATQKDTLDPLFPDSFDMAMVLAVERVDGGVVEAPASANDSTTPEMIDKFWADPKMLIVDLSRSVPARQNAFAALGNTISSTWSTSVFEDQNRNGGTINASVFYYDSFRIRKGQDGILYGNAQFLSEDPFGTNRSEFFCDFFRKLFPGKSYSK